MKPVIFSAAALLGASVLAPALTDPAEAQSYRGQTMTYEQCVQQQRQRQVTGAVIGGILGAVVGAELHDESQDRDREYRRYRGHHRYGYHRGYRHRGYHRGRYGYGRHYEEENDGAVVAGGAVGALAGAAIAGGNCEQYRRGYGRGNAYYRDSGYGREAPYYGGEPGYGGGVYEEGYNQPYRESRRYSTRDGELLGGEGYQDAPYQTRRYGASSGVVTAGASYGGGNCRWMESSNRQVWMCQGGDGIWRPADPVDR